MRQSIKYEFWVGLFVLLGLLGLAFLGLRVANVQGFSSEKTYTLYATFDNIGGLKEHRLRLVAWLLVVCQIFSSTNKPTPQK